MVPERTPRGGTYQSEESKPKLDANPKLMKYFLTYLSTAPVIAFAWLSFTAGLLIEINRFFPDPLIFSF